MTFWTATLGDFPRRLRRRHDPLVPGDVDSERRLLAQLGPLARRREFVLLVNSTRAVARHANDVGIGQRRWRDDETALRVNDDGTVGEY